MLDLTCIAQINLNTNEKNIFIHKEGNTTVEEISDEFDEFTK